MKVILEDELTIKTHFRSYGTLLSNQRSRDQYIYQCLISDWNDKLILTDTNQLEGCQNVSHDTC